MITKPTLFFYILLFSLNTVFAQNYTNQKNFIMPITGTLGITGSFGEIRSDHFHSGIDLRTDNKIGKEVKSTYDGYISRIKVSPIGFGKAIFVDHPNGLTTVYAHLDRYANQINKYIKQVQYQNKSFDIEIFPKPNEFPIKKGELLGYSGNSGGSSGPHLHYEVRTTIDQRIINPVPHFIDVVDSISPIIKSLHIYRLDSVSYANGYFKKKDIPVIKHQNKYAAGNTINAYGKIGIGIDVFDRLNNLSTQCGFKSITLTVNNRIIYNLTLDKFSFAETRFVNSVIDYATRYNTGKEIVKLYAEPNNLFSGLKNLYHKGVLLIKPDSLYCIVIQVTDASDNSSQLSFILKGIYPPLKPESSLIEKNNTMPLACMMDNTIINDTFSLQIPKNSLYDNTNFQYKCINSKDFSYSPMIQLHNPQTPIHQKIKLEIKAFNVPFKYRSKALFATYDDKHKVVAAGGDWEKGKVKGYIKNLGDYFITIDTIVPEIIPINIRQGSTMTGTIGIQLKVEDDFSGIKKIDGYIDGKWVLFEYDQKNNAILYEFDPERLAKNKDHQLVVDVKDNKDNESHFNCSFFW